MNSGTQIAKVRSFDSNGTNRTKNTNFFIRFCNRLAEGVGTGSRRPANCLSMSQSELEQRAAEDMAIAKAMGF
jgi:hypothetical protein